MTRHTILITGGSSGIGANLARQFAKQGRSLALCARRLDRLESLKRELEERYDCRVEIKQLDVENTAQVFEVFQYFRNQLGGIDRVIVNAGIGNGKQIGTGHHARNLQIARTNIVAALAQCEAAVAIFREQNHGHLVVISSLSAMRGLPGHLSAYAASKAALATLAEGIRADLLQSPIKVTTVYPGYIRTEINANKDVLPFAIDEATGGRLIAAAIEREPSRCVVPRWPWIPLGFLIRNLPLSLVARMA